MKIKSQDNYYYLFLGGAVLLIGGVIYYNKNFMCKKNEKGVEKLPIMESSTDAVKPTAYAWPV
jgi:hypothetical protein